MHITRLIKRALMLVGMLSLIVGIAACGSKLAAPAPPAELPIPVVLKFVAYGDVAMDKSTISRAATPPSVNAYHAVGPGGAFSDAITLGPESVESTEAALTLFFAGLSDLGIQGDAQTTTFEGSTAFEGDAAEIKIDFGDFMFDGTNLAGCTGNITRYTQQQVDDAVAGIAGACTVAEINDETCQPTHPICARMWFKENDIDGWQKGVPWIFDVPPRGENLGASRFKFLPPETGDGDRQGVAINFDYTDPENTSLETQQLIETAETNETGEGRLHVLETQVGPAATAVKTFNLYLVTKLWQGPREGDPDFVLSIDYLGRFRESYDFWSGTVDDKFGGVVAVPFQNQCAVISTGAAATDADCADVGGIDIRVGTEAIVGEPPDSAFIIPPDFPDMPTF